MRRGLVSLVLVPALLGGCGQTSAQFDAKLREMAGANERDLLGNLGRIPDNTYRLDDETKVLQWRWDTSYISPGMPPMYHRVGRKSWMSVGGFPPTLVRQDCIVEWTVAKGATQHYRWQGNGCRSVTLISTPEQGPGASPHRPGQ
jgi:hypothetical protein